ncbi:MAG: DNA methyltransferase [Dehalococcoidia bacterium]
MGSVVVDPPYGLSAPPDIAVVLEAWLAGEAYSHGSAGFMASKWDSFVPGPRVWREVLRVLKPGGFLVAFAGTRTVDLMGISLRLAGWEIRDTIHWCYWSGFPKSLDVSKAVDGLFGMERTEEIGRGHHHRAADRSALALGAFAQSYQAGDHAKGSAILAPAHPDALRLAGTGTAIKPAIEPAILARKPLEAVPLSWFASQGVDHIHTKARAIATHPGVETILTDGTRLPFKPGSVENVAANVLRWGTGGLGIDRCRFRPGDVMWPGPDGNIPSEHSGRGAGSDGRTGINAIGTGIVSTPHQGGRFPANLLYCPKASRAERELGCDGLPTKTGFEAVKRKEGAAGTLNPRAGAGRTSEGVRNFHPTVKPVRLMRYLVRLVTPPGEVVLDPFMGSGACGIAATLEGYGYQGAEIDPDFHRIAASRIAHAVEWPVSWAHTEPGSALEADDWVEKVTKAGQLGMF